MWSVLDFQKAFDTVNHKILSKLNYGIRREEVFLINCFIHISVTGNNIQYERK